MAVFKSERFAVDLTTIEKPFCFLDAETRSALKCAHERGEVIEALRISTTDWFDVGEPEWLPGMVYRVRPTPKPPAIELPWSVIDPRWKWAAMDRARSVCIYTVKPTDDDPYNHGEWTFALGDVRRIDDTLIGIRINVTDWRESLTRRPE